MRWVWTAIGIIWSVWTVAAEAPPCAACHADVAGGPHAPPAPIVTSVPQPTAPIRAPPRLSRAW